AMNSVWARKFAPFSTGIASGWMSIRGIRRRRSADRGFVLSDHVDFPTLLHTIEETGAERIIATHGYTDVLVRLLHERGKSAAALQTRFGGEEELDLPPDAAEPEQADSTLNPEPAGEGG